MTDPANTDTALVRAFVEVSAYVNGMPLREDALAALDRLAAAAERADEAERRYTLRTRDFLAASERVTQAEAALLAAQQERDEALWKVDNARTVVIPAYQRDLERLREALRESIGDAYNLITQGESPNQLRQPAAQRIYDRSRAALETE